MTISYTDEMAALFFPVGEKKTAHLPLPYVT